MSGRFDALLESDELVRRILDAVPGGVVHVGTDGAIHNANPEALRILGLRFDEATKLFVSDFAPETFREDGSPFPAAEYPVSLALTTGTSQGPVTIGVRTAAGALSWAVFRAEPIRAADGTLAGAVVTFLDITERKRLDLERQRTEQQWRVLIASLPDYVILCESDGTVRAVNRVLEHLDEQQVIGSSAFDYIDEGSQDDFRREFHRVVEDGTTAHLDIRGVGPGGESVWYETQLAPIREGEGADLRRRVLVVTRDVSERRALLASLAEKERLASIGMIAASVAHEIMNPLTYVLANLDFVVGGRTSDAERNIKALTEAREGARRMQQIVWDLRALGRSGSDELFFVDPRTVLEIALRLSGQEVSGTASVVLELCDVPCVLASESRLCQVFINLLVNAAQAMATRERSDREIRVKTRHDEATSLVAVEITDTGEGISSERLRRIFEPFFTTKSEGTGLGLSICRDIITRMGGRIDVSSVAGVGTTFTVWLSTEREANASAPTTPR